MSYICVEAMNATMQAQQNQTMADVSAATIFAAWAKKVADDWTKTCDDLYNKWVGEGDDRKSDDPDYEDYQHAQNSMQTQMQEAQQPVDTTNGQAQQDQTYQSTTLSLGSAYKDQFSYTSTLLESNP